MTDDAIRAAVEQERARCVKILHEEGWLGRSEQRIAHPYLFDIVEAGGCAPPIIAAKVEPEPMGGTTS